VVDGGWVDSCSGIAVAIEHRTREPSLQHHLHTLWEDEVIEETVGAGCFIESELLQGGEANPSAGRSVWWLGNVEEADLDELQQRASCKEGCQVLNGDFCSRLKSEPREGGEVEITEVCAERVQRKTREFWKSPSENFGEFFILFSNICIVCDLEVLQLWC